MPNLAHRPAISSHACSAILLSIFALASTLQGGWVPTSGPGGGSVQSQIAVGDTFYAGGANGAVFRRKAGTLNWEFAGYGMEGKAGEIQGLLWGNGIFYAATTGLSFYSSDGAHWTAMQGVGGAYSVAAVDSLLFLGTTAPARIKCSVDSGKTWVSRDSGISGYTVTDLLVKGTSLYAAVHSGGVFRSDDRGVTWTGISTGIGNLWMWDLETLGDHLFLGTSGGIYRLDPGSTTWELADMADSAYRQETCYGLGTSGNTVFGAAWKQVLKSADYGKTWVKAGLPLAGSVLCLAATGGELSAGLFTEGVETSIDGGLTWAIRNAGLTAKHVPSLLSLNGRLVAGTQYGVHTTSDKGSTWAKSSNIYSQIGSLALFDGKVYAGSYYGLWRSGDDGSSWSRPDSALRDKNVTSLGTDGLANLYAGTLSGEVLRLTSGQSQWNACNDSGRAAKPVRSLLVSSDKVWAGATDTVYCSSLEGHIWAPLGGPPLRGVVSALTKLDAKLIAGTSKRVYWHDSSGPGWTASQDSVAVTGFARNGSRLYAATYRGVYESDDGGVRWTAVGSELSGAVVEAVAVHDGSLYAGTATRGVWRYPLASVDARPASARWATPSPYTRTINFSGRCAIPAAHVNARFVLYNLRGTKLAELPGHDGRQLRYHLPPQHLAAGIVIGRLESEPRVIGGAGSR